MKGYKSVLKSVALLLAVLMALTASLVGCTEEPNDPAVDGTTTDPDVSGEVTTTVVTDIYSDLPQADYSGFTFDILTTAVSWTDYECMTVETVDGDTVNSAIFARNIEVEERFGITISETLVNGDNDAKKLVSTSMLDKTFDLYTPAAPLAAQLAIQGQLVDLNTTTINLDSIWWDKGYNDSISLCDATYIAFGDLSLSYAGGTFCLAFNPELVEMLDLTSPIELYADDNWTFATMHQLTEAAKSDESGDGAISDPARDRYGLVGHINQVRHLILGSGESLVSKNSEGIYRLDLGNEIYFNAFTDVMRKFVVTDASVWHGKTEGYDEWNKQFEVTGYAQIFNEGRSLFIMDVMAAFKDNRNTDVPYKFVELPKYDVKQEDYMSVRYAGSRGVSIITGFDESELERNSDIIECLAAYTHRDVIPAFIDITLYVKYAKDEESSAMLNRILSRPGYLDVALVYNWGGINSLLESMNKMNRVNASSSLKVIEDKFNKEIENMMAGFEGR